MEALETAEPAICRLCLKTCEDNFEPIEGKIEEIIKFLLPSMDLNISKDPVACNSCVDQLKKCFNFVTTSLHKKGHDVNCLTDDTDMKFDELEACESKDNITDPCNASTGSNKCYFCMTEVDAESSISLKSEEVKEMLEKYFQMLNKTAITKPIKTEEDEQLRNNDADVEVKTEYPTEEMEEEEMVGQEEMEDVTIKTEENENEQ